MSESGAIALEEKLVRAIRAGQRVLVLHGEDEVAMMEVGEAVADRLGLEMRTYSRTEGIDRRGSTPPAQFVREGLHAEGSSLWIARDLLRDHDGWLRRALREHGLDPNAPPLLCLESQLYPHMLAPEFWVEAFAVPDLASLEEAIAAWAQSAARQGDEAVLSQVGAHADTLARDGLGLTWRELRLAMREAVSVDPDSLEPLRFALRAAKARRLANQGMVEAVNEVPSEQLGGLANFKTWLATRARAFEPDARSAGIPLPRGVLLIGVQGCGKSLAARVCAHALDLPLYRLDPGRVFDGTVGASESRLDALLMLLDRMAPLVLWLDEIDKSLAGSESSASDGGTTSRVVGRLLTWLQEREHPVFVVATANDPARLPPEMLRRGRFDELFFVDLPESEERAEILDIHLRHRPLAALGQAPPIAGDPEPFLALARGATGFSGAELEAVVVEARLAAYADGRPIAHPDIARALEATIPLSTTRSEDIAALREWAKSRTRLA
jgi:SpoVK/Ycf46/Vps4 family AAA+-type ATPase